MAARSHRVSVFAATEHGGNPATITFDADALSDAEMQAIARRDGHECGFVLAAPAGAGCDAALRFWVPNHEMEMCGHATVGAVWLMDRLGRLPGTALTVWTRSGHVDARVRDAGTPRAAVEISQPVGQVDPLADPWRAEIAAVLRIPLDALADAPLQNARTSRAKTLVPLRGVATLDALQPDLGRIEALCERLDSTGLYPYAWSDAADGQVDARQFPKSSGYAEDPATGVAAAALFFGLRGAGRDGEALRVRQGRAMGRPSEITVRLRRDAGGAAQGCWLGGPVRMEEAA